MKKLISRRTHGLLDYLTVVFALTFPRVLCSSDRTRNAVTLLALGKLSYALFTRHELGLVKTIPMKAHLTLDAAGGAALCALPFALEEEDPATIGACLAMGIFDVLAAPMTDTRDYQLGPRAQWLRPRVAPQALPTAAQRNTGAHATALV
jgi:hypothetical protein